MTRTGIQTAQASTATKRNVCQTTALRDKPNPSQCFLLPLWKMFLLRTDCQYPIYSTVQQGGGCLFALARQTTLPLPHCEQEAVFPWGASQRISDPSSAAADSPICLLVMSNPGRGTLLHTAVPSLLFPRPCHCFCSLPSPVSPLLPWLHCHLSESGLSHTPPSCHLQFPVAVSVFGGSQTQMLNSLLQQGILCRDTYSFCS